MNTLRIAALCFALAPLAHAGDEDAAYVWTGKRGAVLRNPHVVAVVTSYGGGGPSEVRRIPPDARANGLRRQLAELRLAEATEGSSTDLEAQRLELWIRACDGEPFEGQGELLVELALERAERLALRGESEAALGATQELLVPGRLVDAAGEFELAPADAAWLERAAAWRLDPRLLALRGTLAPAPAAQAVSTDVETVITEHLYKGNKAAVLQFGARAVPVCESYVRAHLDDYPAMGAIDPLTFLFELDEPRGANFALEHLEDPGDVFPLRILRSMREAHVLTNDGTWAFVPATKYGQPYQRAELMQTAWRDLLERLIARGDLASDAFREVGLLVAMDALTPGLAAALESAIRGEDPTRYQKAMAALEDSGWRDSARPLLVRLLDHPQSQVRSFVADALSSFDDCSELWPLANDPSVGVRRAVLDGLRPGRPSFLQWHGIAHTSVRRAGEESLRGLDRGGMAVLERLLRDAEPEIYLEALDILVDHPGLLANADTLRALTEHADARVRRKLPFLRVGALPDAGVLAALADDPDPEVCEAVDAALHRVGDLGPNPANSTPPPGWKAFLNTSSAWSDAYLPALQTRLEASQRVPESLANAVAVAGFTPAGARGLARAALETDSDELSSDLAMRLALSPNWAGTLRGWHLVEPAFARDVLARAWRQTPNPRWWSWVQEALLIAPEGYAQAALAWSADPELPWPLRLLALRVSEPLADQAWCARVHRLLADTPELEQRSNDWGSAVYLIGKSLSDGELAAHVLADLATSEDVPGALLEAYLRGLRETGVPDPQTARLILERWGDRGGPYVDLAQVAMEQLQASEEEPLLELFERLLRVDGDIAEHALRAMGRLHLRAHLPLLERALMGELAARAEQRAMLQMGAARALSSYFDDSAAELLLRGVGATSDVNVREVFFQSLDTIRRYQDERARWSTRADAARVRAESIAELVGLIETGEAVQRVEAVRALGTLAAIEELPRLVRLTGSQDAALAAAAKQALDAIRATQGGD